MNLVVEQFKGTLSVLGGAEGGEGLPMDSGAGRKLALSAGPIGPVPSASLAAALDLLSVVRAPLSVGAECIILTRDTMGGTATGSALSFQAGGEGVEARSARFLYYPFGRAKFIRIGQALGISGPHDGTPTAPTPARVLIEQKKEGGRGCE